MAEKKKQSLEEMLSRLEEIVSQLEDDKLELDKSLKLYEEGMKLVGKCTGELENAQRKIKILQRQPDGNIDEVNIAPEQLS